MLVSIWRLLYRCEVSGTLVISSSSHFSVLCWVQRGCLRDMQGTRSLPPQAYTKFPCGYSAQGSERSKAQKESGEQLHCSCSAQQSDSELDLSSPGVLGRYRELSHPGRHWRLSSRYYSIIPSTAIALLYCSWCPVTVLVADNSPVCPHLVGVLALQCAHPGGGHGTLLWGPPVLRPAHREWILLRHVHWRQVRLLSAGFWLHLYMPLF